MVEASETFKAGLEIHQQLDTHKLFCSCPSVLRSDEPKVIVKRRLHAVAGESGEVDVAAKHEFEKDREFIYQGYDTNCLVEYDEEPPYLINEEALEISLHIAMLLNCKILPISQIMRKTVVDGSNTSGFQRSVLIARNGYVETSFGKVRIGSIYLEEDAARPASDTEQKQTASLRMQSVSDETGFSSTREPARDFNLNLSSQTRSVSPKPRHKSEGFGDIESEKVKIYKLDRLGIPLVEIQTEADIKTPEQAKEVALFIGDILRSCKVKRGIGTIRQDINISIKGHPRVEIKGFQDVKMFVPTIENEIKRQGENLKKKKSMGEVRNALADGSTEFLRPMPGSARMYPETDLPLLRITRDIVNKAKRTLPKLRSEVKGELVKKGLREEEVQILLKQGRLEEFESLLKLINEPRFIFKVLVETPKEVGRHFGKDVSEILTLDIIESIVDKVRRGELDRSDVKHVMEEIVKGKRFDEAVKLEKIDLSEIEDYVVKLIREKPGLSVSGYMGLIMDKFKGQVSGKDVSEMLRKLVK